MKTIDRKYINLRERSEEVHSIAQDGLVAESIGWEAAADGQLDTGENIYITRFGKTAQNAYRLLEMALAEQDWKVA